MRPLKVGVALPDSEGMMGGATARWGDLGAYARLAEDIGFDSVWVEDHLLFRFEGAIHIVHALLRTGRVDFAGRYYAARECELRPRGPRPNGPPILVGTTGERMLGIAARYADQWNDHFCFFGNTPAGIPPLREKVDAACRGVGRDPATLERTLVVLIDAAGGSPIPDSVGTGVPPLAGSPEEIAAGLRAFAAEGIGHVQIYAVPMTLAGLEALAPMLEALDRA